MPKRPIESPFVREMKRRRTIIQYHLVGTKQIHPFEFVNGEIHRKPLCLFANGSGQFRFGSFKMTDHIGPLPFVPQQFYNDSDFVYDPILEYLPTLDFDAPFV